MKKKIAIFLLWTAAAAFPLTLIGQPIPARPPIEQMERPGEPRPPLPEFGRQPARPEFVLPPIPFPRSEGLLSSGVRVFVTRFQFTGNTAITTDELAAITAPFERREIGNEELEEARYRITRRYVEAGYINSGAIIPDQKVSDGVIAIRVIEGRLNEIAVTGENRFHPDFIRKRLALGAGPPLNINGLQERMQILLQNPQLERINAELAPGVGPGESVLRVVVKEAPPFLLGASLANNRSPAIGSRRAEIQGTARDLLGYGESFNARAGNTSGLKDYAFNIAVPVSPYDTMLSLHLDRNGSTVMEPPFNSIGVRANSENIEIGLSQPLYRTIQKTLSMGLTLSRRESQTFLLDQPFSFTPGARDGRSVVGVMRWSAEWLDRNPERVIAARFTVSYGLNAFGSTIDGGLPDSKFVARLGQFQWAKRLGENRGQLLFRTDVQLTNGSLLPLEKFAVGGVDTVRGYRENTLVKDAGWVASIEYRVPVARLPLGKIGDQPEDGTVQLAAFADTGRAGELNDAGSLPSRISSVGPGIRWDITRDFGAQLYKGFARNKINYGTRDLQNKGIHFRIGLQKAF